MRRSRTRHPATASLAAALALATAGSLAVPACVNEDWAPSACGGGVLENRCTTLFECNPGLWGRPEQCERQLQEGTYPPSCADPSGWLTCFCRTSPTTCELATEYGITCGRAHCWR